MIIWGSKGKTKTIDDGGFHCPRCGEGQTFALKEVRTWFTLYFIPVFPMGEAGRYIECRNCAGTFDEATRDYDPAEANAQFRAFFEPLMMKSMIVMAQSDGSISHDEIESIADIMTNLSEGAFEADDVEAYMPECRDLSLGDVLTPAAGELSDDGKVLVLQGLYAVADTDGFMDEGEVAAMHEAGKCLGFRKKQIKQFLDSAKA